jgi:hypothetical protein
MRGQNGRYRVAGIQSSDRLASAPVAADGARPRLSALFNDAGSTAAASRRAAEARGV